MRRGRRFARVIGPDFVEHNLDPNSITEEPARGGDYKTYSDGKRLHAPFPAIAQGVVVEEEYVERENEPFFGPGHTGFVSFGRERAPVEHSQAVFEAPASLPLRTDTVLLPSLKPTRTVAGGRVTLIQCGTARGPGTDRTLPAIRSSSLS